MKRLGLGFIITILCLGGARAGILQPGFDRQEYADVLWLQFHALSDSIKTGETIPLQQHHYRKVFMTPEVGLYNKAALFLRADGLVVLELRGTVNKPESWFENFYAGMVPATGSLQLGPGFTFDYRLAHDSTAAVHLGWLIGTGFLARSYLPVLDSLVQKGHTDIIVTGHSQGGALAFLTTSYLHYHYAGKGQPLRLKTYASAAPKPGNLQYAYDFDRITAGGMGFRVVNAADWVPETPFSLQTLRDFNAANPFINARSTIRKQKIPVRWYLNSVYRKLDNSSAKAARRFQKYLGNKMYRLTKKPLPGYEKPVLHFSMSYATAGSPVILAPDAAYQQQFAFNGQNVFVHHMYAPYRYLLDLHYPDPKN
jgi:hypothetical protein